MVFLLMGALAGACTRSEGDFGRYKSDDLYDTLLPTFGAIDARSRRELVSSFPLTDDEKRLKDQAIGLLRPPHAQDWIGETLVQLGEARVLPRAYAQFNPERYYTLLRRDNRHSNTSFYNRITNDARADTQLLQSFCLLARGILETDDKRQRTLSSNADKRPQDLKNVTARVSENRSRIVAVGQGVRFRVRAYQHALERLELETPESGYKAQAKQAIDILEHTQGACVNQAL